MRLASSSVLIALTAGILSCSLTQPSKKDFSAPPLEKVLSENYDAVWRAIGLSMVKYQMKVSDYDSGVYETQPIRSEKAWVSPHITQPPSGGQRYTIVIKVLKGKDTDGKTATRLTILKRAEVQRDFFSDFEKIPSDGLEEKSIMYRIERELLIEKSLAKVKK